MNMDEILKYIQLVASLVCSISAASAIIIKILKKSLIKVTKEAIDTHMTEIKRNQQQNIKSLESKMQSKLDDIKSSTDTQMTALTNQLQSLSESQSDTNAKLKASLLASTRDRINQAHDYYLKKGFIGTHSLFIVEELYSSYTALGGNSFITHQMEDIRELKLISAEMEQYDKEN